ncbi:hypothetical protein SDC9_148187 [bioreactor metagenome]|uniref:Uncharacterized protein n=1 Tax=bioreactor metagenome TaxID=1076179 RepID=A0A645EIL7_9ZZZZ
MVPKLKLIGITAPFVELFEQRVSLGERLVIIGQHLGKAGGRLSTGQVQVASSFIRPAFNNAGHLRQKDHGAEVAHQLVGGGFHTVQQHFLA